MTDINGDGYSAHLPRLEMSWSARDKTIESWYTSRVTITIRKATDIN